MKRAVKIIRRSTMRARHAVPLAANEAARHPHEHQFAVTVEVEAPRGVFVDFDHVDECVALASIQTARTPGLGPCEEIAAIIFAKVSDQLKHGRVRSVFVGEDERGGAEYSE